MFEVYKETDKTWIVLSKIPLRYIGEFKDIKIAREVCEHYNSKEVKSIDSCYKKRIAQAKLEAYKNVLNKMNQLAKRGYFEYSLDWFDLDRWLIEELQSEVQDE